MCRPGLKNEKHGHWTWTCLDRPSQEKRTMNFPHPSKAWLFWYPYFLTMTIDYENAFYRYRVHRHRTNISVCFSDVLVSCDTIMNITRGRAPGSCAWSEAHIHRGQSWDRGNFVVGRSGENREWPGSGGGCQLSGHQGGCSTSRKMGTMRHCGLLLLGWVSIAN